VNEKNYGEQLQEIFSTKFELGFDPPVVFIDTHYNKSNPEELKAFERETEKLWKISLNRKPFECLTRYELSPSSNTRRRPRTKNDSTLFILQIDFFKCLSEKRFRIS
jgi:hypothetical protein